MTKKTYAIYRMKETTQDDNQLYLIKFSDDFDEERQAIDHFEKNFFTEGRYFILPSYYKPPLKVPEFVKAIEELNQDRFSGEEYQDMFNAIEENEYFAVGAKIADKALDYLQVEDEQRNKYRSEIVRSTQESNLHIIPKLNHEEKKLVINTLLSTVIVKYQEIEKNRRDSSDNTQD